jgi:hypothetical protein
MSFHATGASPEGAAEADVAGSADGAADGAADAAGVEEGAVAGGVDSFPPPQEIDARRTRTESFFMSARTLVRIFSSS